MMFFSQVQSEIFREISQERARQDAKFGAKRNHSPKEWLMILGEEVGEVNKAALESHFFEKSHAEYRKELIQVAAVAVAMIESYDRQSKIISVGIRESLSEQEPEPAPKVDFKTLDNSRPQLFYDVISDYAIIIYPNNSNEYWGWLSDDWKKGDLTDTRSWIHNSPYYEFMGYL